MARAVRALARVSIASRRNLQGIADLVAARVSEGSIASCAVAAVCGERHETFVCGEANVADGIAASTDTLFHICSCSKAFTAAAVAELVEGGVTSWDTPVQQILPEFALRDPWIMEHLTLRDLAGMRLGLSRSGIAEWGFRPQAPALQRLARASGMTFDAPFRDRFSYSNLGYIALAAATARLAGMDYARCMERLVFSPCGLERARLRPEQSMALPHLPVDGRMVPVPELTGESSEGSARVHICAADAVSWLSYLLRAAKGGEGGAITELFKPQIPLRPTADGRDGLPVAWAYGFGWHISAFKGRTVFNHGGGGRGWRAHAILDPQRDSAVMVFAAHEGVGAEALMLALIDLISGEEKNEWESLLAARAEREAKARDAIMSLRDGPGGTPIDISEAAGLYENPVTGRVRIDEDDDGSLRFAAEDAPAFDAKLLPIGDGIFEFRFSNPAMRPMKSDPHFRARIVRDESGLAAAETTYFGTLVKVS
jgi:CubicO group peptidase (beta-lactamase class C family)